jgi:hypothetical protein
MGVHDGAGQGRDEGKVKEVIIETEWGRGEAHAKEEAQGDEDSGNAAEGDGDAVVEAGAVPYGLVAGARGGIFGGCRVSV